MKALGCRLVGLVAVMVIVTLAPAGSPDWDSVALVRHDVLQAVNPDGSPAYSGEGFPLRLRGVVLNNPEDWLDGTPTYDPGYTPWFLGGQWEIFVQAVDLPDSAYDDGDFGGSAAYMGQNYGNVPWLGDPFFSYTDAEWLIETERLDYSDGSGAAALRAGDLIEVRARVGLHYQGKFNVNEAHNNDRDWDTGELGTAHDFEIVRLEAAYGLPAPAELSLRDLKNDADVAIFDAQRATGGERYQATRVRIGYVSVVGGDPWGSDADIVVADATGRTFTLALGHSASLDAVEPPSGYFDVIGIVNQSSASGQGGYYLVVLNAADIIAPPFGPADVNCDGLVNVFDIDPFVLALTDLDAYLAAYPHCDPATADLNVDNAVNVFDIDPFVVALTGS
jgi:hypothetical protein